MDSLVFTTKRQNAQQFTVQSSMKYLIKKPAALILQQALGLFFEGAGLRELFLIGLDERGFFCLVVGQVFVVVEAQ